MSSLKRCFCNLNPILLRHLQLYIVYLGDVKHGHPNDVIASHHDLLINILGRYVASFQLGRACYLLIFLRVTLRRTICKLIMVHHHSSMISSNNVSHQEINCVFVCKLLNFQQGRFFGLHGSQLQAWLLRLRSNAH